MANYHVTKDKDAGDWKMLSEKAQIAPRGIMVLRREAEKAAKEFSKNSGGGEVKIHKPSGPIRDSDTVPPGHDPNPPKDAQH